MIATRSKNEMDQGLRLSNYPKSTQLARLCEMATCTYLVLQPQGMYKHVTVGAVTRRHPLLTWVASMEKN